MIPPRPSRNPGFTLIELLTVIAIIGVLAAIVISTVSTVRSKARITRCLSNMRQAGVAFSLYAGDHRNTLPTQRTDGVPLTNSASWPAQLSPYIVGSEKRHFRLHIAV